MPGNWLEQPISCKRVGLRYTYIKIRMRKKKFLNHVDKSTGLLHAKKREANLIYNIYTLEFIDIIYHFCITISV